MADEVQKTTQDGVPQADEVVVVADVPQTEKPPAAAAVAKEQPLVLEQAKEENVNLVETEVIEEKAAAAANSDTAEDDGAKTVEAIEETIVSVSSSVQPEQLPAAKEPSDAKADVVSEDKGKDAKTEDKVATNKHRTCAVALAQDFSRIL